jgi:hypothetical protein
MLYICIKGNVVVDYYTCSVKWGVGSRTVKVISFKPLSPHRFGFEPRQGLWILTSQEANQQAYRTLVVLLRCPFVPKILHGGTPEVFLHQ